jgi:hypothetical protein
MRFTVAFPPTLLPNRLPSVNHTDLVQRGVQRGDLQNPPSGTAAGRILDDVLQIVWPHLGEFTAGRQVHSRALAVVPPGEPAQPWHCDLDGCTEYHTLIVPLTTEYDAGGTEFKDGEARLPVRGTAYCFDGAFCHRGAAHRGRKRRVFAAYTIVPNNWAKKDDNVVCDRT